MKISYFSTDHGFDITFIPETPAEVAELSRLAMNKSEVAPVINLYMDSKPCAQIWIKKLEKTKQRTTITKSK